MFTPFRSTRPKHLTRPARTPRRGRTALGAAIAAGLAVSLTPLLERPAEAAPAPLAMPFACGTAMAASTYSGHGQAIDFYLPGSAYSASYGTPMFAPADASISFTNPNGPDGGSDTTATLKFNDGSGRAMVVRHLRAAGIPSKFKGLLPTRAIKAGEKFAEIGFNGTLVPPGKGNSHAHVEMTVNGQPSAVAFENKTITAQNGGASATNPHTTVSTNCARESFAAGARGRILEVTDGASYTVAGDGVAREFPSADSFWCAVDSGQPRVPVKVDRATFNSANFTPGPKVPECLSLPRYQGWLFRQSNGVASVVDSGALRPVTDGFTYDCLVDRKTRLKDNIDPALLNGKSRGAAMPVCLSPGRSNNTLFSLPDGTSYYVGADGKAHWSPDVPTFQCRANGGARRANVTRAHIQSLGAEGGWDDCFQRDLFVDKVVRHSDGDATYVNWRGTGAWIPDQATWLCRTQGQRKAVVDVRRRNYVDALNAGNGGAWDYCLDVNQLKGKILRHEGGGDAHYIDGNGRRHWIPSGQVYNCLVSRGVPVVGTRWREYVNNIPETNWATC